MLIKVEGSFYTSACKGPPVTVLTNILI